MKTQATNQVADTAEKTFCAEETVGALVIRLPQLRVKLEQLGIDYCCGGKTPLGLAVRQAELNWEAVTAELSRELERLATAEPAKDWTKVSLNELADHILDKHHSFTRSQLGRIEMLLDRVIRAHGNQHGEMLAILDTHFKAIRDELVSHLMKEEEILFPAIKALDLFISGKGPRPVVHCGSVAHPIRQMEHEHDNAGALLVEMRQTTDGYELPADACQTFAALYEALPALEADLHEHIHLENNILFPASIRQEEQMNAV